MSSQRRKDYETVNHALIYLRERGPRGRTMAEPAIEAFNRIAFDHGRQSEAIVQLRSEMPKSWFEELGISEELDEYSRETLDPIEEQLDSDEDDEEA